MRILLIFAFLLIVACDNSPNNDPNINPCDISKQGFTLSAPNFNTENYYLDDNAMQVAYVTGDPNGDYLHIYSLQNPLVDFYTYGIQTGNSTTFAPTFNSTNGSYFSFQGTPLPANNDFVANTINGGSNVGDVVTIKITGTLASESGSQEIEIFLCVTIDSVTSVAKHAYITDGSQLKIYNISTPTNPVLIQSVPANTSYHVELIANIAYVGQFDATEPFVTYVNVASPAQAYIHGSIPKGSDFARLSDVQNVDGYTYLSDEYKGLHIIHHMNNTHTRHSTSDAMSMTKIDDEFFLLDQNMGLHKHQVNNPAVPVDVNINNTSDLDLASYPYSNGSFHSRIQAISNQHILGASIADSRLIKFSSLDLSNLAELNLGGYVTAMDQEANFAIVSMKPSPDAPLQNGFDGIKLIDLINMNALDSKVLNNASGVAITGNYVYATDSNGLHIYTIQSGNLILEQTLASGFGNYITLDN